MKKLIAKISLGVLAAGIGVLPALAASSVSVNFEQNTYVVGNINNQDGWTKTGGYDAAVVSNTYGFGSFGSQTFRISDAVTSGSFGDQTFAKPLSDAVGEADSTFGSFATTAKERHFEMQFDMATTMPTQQTGLHLSVSPDRGDGSRMSYLRFEDSTLGVNVFFVDVQGHTNPANFVESQIATDLDRGESHTIKLTLDTYNGPSNDVVKVWVDGLLVKTGTSWENYYRYDSESSFEQTPRVVKTVLFRAGGVAVVADSGEGFIFDNLTLSSGRIEDLCKGNGWQELGFKNQGLCVSSVVSHRQ